MTDEGRERVERGYQALENQDVQTAAQLADSLISDHPGEAEGYVLRCEAYVAQDNGAEAIQCLETGLESCGRSPMLLGARASLLLDYFEDPIAARADLDQALKSKLEDGLAGDLRLMHAEACLLLQDPKAALESAQTASALLPQAPEPHYLQGQAFFDLHRLDAALAAVDRALEIDPNCAPAVYTRGEILFVQGQGKQAEQAFLIARELDPETFFQPVQISTEQFEQVVAEAIDGLPDVVAQYLSNVAIVVEDTPDLDTLKSADPPLSPACLGMFEGTPRPQESVEDPWSTLPKCVRLYRHNILRLCPDRASVSEVIATTLVHEIGHFLGLEEDDLIDRGLA